jgi:hypothetical protein
MNMRFEAMILAEYFSSNTRKIACWVRIRSARIKGRWQLLKTQTVMAGCFRRLKFCMVDMRSGVLLFVTSASDPAPCRLIKCR